MLRLRITVALAALVAACTRGPDARLASEPGVDGGSPPQDAGATTAAAGEASPAIDRGPTKVTVEGDPNGLWWDTATHTLFIADSANNRILKWNDGGGIAKARDLPPVPDKSPGLGQLVMARNGTIFATRFGFGTTGGVVYAAADGTTGSVPGLDPRRRRIGLAVAADGTLYDAYFVKDADQSAGAVARLDPAGTETDVLPGLKKPVGVLVDGTMLLVSDRGGGTLLKAPLAAPSTWSLLAEVPGADLLCLGPDGSLFTGGTTGEIRQITRDGKVRAFAGGFSSVRGVAYDAESRRLFASEHNPKGSVNALRILPVN
jgi:sugar lactone lactonase YvrE